MIFNYMPAHPFLPLSLSSSLVWLSFCLPALPVQTFNLLTGPVKAFLITKVAPLSLPWPASPHTIPHHSLLLLFPPVNQLVRQSMTSLIWHLLDLPSLFIHPSCPTVLLSHCSLPLSLSLSDSLSLCLTLSEVLLQLYQSPFSLANQINSHSQSNRNPSKASAQSSMMPSKVQDRPPQHSLPLPSLCSAQCGCAVCAVYSA